MRPEELPALLEEGVLVVDVRPADRRSTPLPFAAEWVPLEKIQKGEHGLPRRPLLLVCEKGLLSQVAALYLEAEGYEAMSLEGGLQALTQGSSPVEWRMLSAVSVAQLVRAPDCGSGGRGFKSHRSPQAATPKGVVF